MIKIVIIIISAIVFIISLIAGEKDWAPWTGVFSSCVLMYFMFLGIATNSAKPKEIETKVQPQIDTVITIKNGTPDTTYIYTFVKENQKK